MRPFKSMLTRAVATATTIGLTTAGAVAFTASPANALRESNYGLQTSAYATRIFSEMAGVESGRTAWSYINCTRMTGIKRNKSLLDINVPDADNPLISVSGADNRNKTFRAPKRGMVAAARSTSTIAHIELGSNETALLQIQDLKATSTAWADKSGKLHADNNIKAAKIRLLNRDLIPGEVSAPLQQLFDATEAGLNEVLALLTQNEYVKEGIEIPGLGVVYVGFERTNEKRKTAAAEAAVLKVKLYGPDQAKTGDDNSVVNIGRTWARINKGIPAGIMRGKGYGANAELLGGIVGAGELGMMPLPCRGTDGKVKGTGLAKLDLAGQLGLGGAYSRVFGKQEKTGRAVAWTEGGLADVKLGPLELKGVFARAKAKQKKNGKVKTSIKGAIAEILMDGESQGGFTHKEVADIPPLEVPGVLKIEFFKKSKWGVRGVRVSAVVITLLEDTPVGSVIRLGNAQTKIQKY